MNVGGVEHEVQSDLLDGEGRGGDWKYTPIENAGREVERAQEKSRGVVWPW